MSLDMTELTKWFVYLLPLNIAAVYLLTELARYLRAITPRPYRIKSDGIEVTAMTMEDVCTVFDETVRVKEKYGA